MNTVDSRYPWNDIVTIAHEFGLSFKKVNNDFYKLLDFYGEKKEALDELEKYYTEKLEETEAGKEGTGTTCNSH